jgi:pimeloyl-ACP methyl ester carboxylesterase
VAGNLDHQAWTEELGFSPLRDSLNPADAWQSLVDIPQLHLVGSKDSIVSENNAKSYQSRFPKNKNPEVIIIPQFDHACCWLDAWPTLLENINHY